MPRLRSLKPGPYVTAKATPEEEARARELAQQDMTCDAIAKALGRSPSWVSKVTLGARKKIVYRDREKIVYRRFRHFPHDNPELAARIRNLAKRGFDVPPSKQDDWDHLRKLGYSVAERKQILKLE